MADADWMLSSHPCSLSASPLNFLLFSPSLYCLLLDYIYIYVNKYIRMPLKKSSRAIRVRGLSTDLLLDDFRGKACRLNKAAGESKKAGLLSRGTSTVSDPECSLALQGDAKTGTVTFASTDVKGKAIKETTDWEVDDNFDGLTVLHTADKADLE